MCFAVPLRLTVVEGARGVVSNAGIDLEIRLDLLENPRVGEYVLVHAGYAIQLMEESEAAENIALIEEMIAASGEPPRG
jgi:hydrogenase expression/formation protein HypC